MAQKPRSTVTVAAIDIGTNTILLAIGRKEHDGSLSIIHDEVQFARLGKNVDILGIIEEERIQVAEAILKKYAALCKRYSVHTIIAFATSAMRDAVNADAVQERLEISLGTKIEVIDGKREAQLSFMGSVPDKESAIVVDIGGGSTEIIVGGNNMIEFSQSINIGAVRLTERFFPLLPPNSEQIMLARELVEQKISKIPLYNYPMYCVAGTPVTLACIAQGLDSFEKEKIQGYILSGLVINVILRQLLSSTSDEIRLMNCVTPERADILPAGTLILDCILRHFLKNNCIVSVGGLRYGIIKEYILLNE